MKEKKVAEEEEEDNEKVEKGEEKRTLSRSAGLAVQRGILWGVKFQNVKVDDNLWIKLPCKGESISKQSRGSE